MFCNGVTWPDGLAGRAIAPVDGGGNKPGEGADVALSDVGVPGWPGDMFPKPRADVASPNLRLKSLKELTRVDTGRGLASGLELSVSARVVVSSNEPGMGG
jgi:hypothetical protein